MKMIKSMGRSSGDEELGGIVGNRIRAVEAEGNIKRVIEGGVRANTS